MKTLLKWCSSLVTKPWSRACFLPKCQNLMPDKNAARSKLKKAAAAAAAIRDWRPAHQMSRGISPEKTPFHTVLPASNHHLRTPFFFKDPWPIFQRIQRSVLRQKYTSENDFIGGPAFESLSYHQEIERLSSSFFPPTSPLHLSAWPTGSLCTWKWRIQMRFVLRKVMGLKSTLV